MNENPYRPHIITKSVTWLHIIVRETIGKTILGAHPSIALEWRFLTTFAKKFFLKRPEKPDKFFRVFQGLTAVSSRGMK
jgi:hypothetical protein